MSKLLQRLSDASKSGVYRAPHGRDIADAMQGSRLRLARIDLAGVATKEALLARIVAALDFPPWFGGNWDALEDCMTDFTWSKFSGHVLVFEAAGDLPADERGILIDILATAASFWKDRKQPFFAVFVDGPARLPELYRASE